MFLERVGWYLLIQGQVEVLPDRSSLSIPPSRDHESALDRVLSLLKFKDLELSTYLRRYILERKSDSTEKTKTLQLIAQLN